MGLSAKTYEVEAIVKAQVSHKYKRNITWKYFVKWKGYKESQNTWEPVESFEESPTLIEKFWDKVDLGIRNRNRASDFKVKEEVFPRDSAETLSDADADGEEVEEEEEEAVGSASAPQPTLSKGRGRKRQSKPPSATSQAQNRKRGKRTTTMNKENMLTKRRSSRVSSEKKPLTPEVPGQRKRRQRISGRKPVAESEENSSGDEGSEDEGTVSSRPRKRKYPQKSYRRLDKRSRKSVVESDTNERKSESSHDGSLFSGSEGDTQNDEIEQEIAQISGKNKIPVPEPLDAHSNVANLTSRVSISNKEKQSDSGITNAITNEAVSTKILNRENPETISVPSKRSLFVEMPTKSYNRPKKPRVQVYEDPSIAHALATRVRAIGKTFSNILGGSSGKAKLVEKEKKEKPPSSALERSTSDRRASLEPPTPISGIERELLQSDGDVSVSENTLPQIVEPTATNGSNSTPSNDNVVTHNLTSPDRAPIQATLTETIPNPPSAAELLNGILENHKDLPEFEEGDEEDRNQVSDNDESSNILHPDISRENSQSEKATVLGNDDATAPSGSNLESNKDQDSDHLQVSQSDVLALSESFCWKQSTIFGPAMPPLALLEKISTSTESLIPQKTKLIISLYLSPSCSIPVTFKDVFPSTHDPSQKINNILSSTTASPPGKLFTERILDHITVGGSSARVVADESASTEEKGLLDKLRSALENKELFVAVVGECTLVFLSSSNFDIANKLRIPSALIGLSGEIIVQNVTINDETGYANLVLDCVRDLDL